MVFYFALKSIGSFPFPLILGLNRIIELGYGLSFSRPYLIFYFLLSLGLGGPGPLKGG